MSNLKIAVIEGTTRPKRKSIHAANLVFSVAQDFAEVEPVFVDPADFNLPADGSDDANKDPRYSKITKEADGFFIIVPEYNHSFPGSLKRLLDSELKNYIHKPAALAGVSSGPWGGVRAIESLLPVLCELGLTPTFSHVQFPFINKIFDKEGGLQDEKYLKRIEKGLAELVWMAKALRWGRKNLPSKNHK